MTSDPVFKFKVRPLRVSSNLSMYRDRMTLRDTPSSTSKRSSRVSKKGKIESETLICLKLRQSNRGMEVTSLR